MRIFMIIFLAVFFVATAHAAKLNSDFAPLGYIEAKINGVDHKFVAYRDLVKDRKSVRFRKMTMWDDYAVRAGTVSAKGTPDNPTLKIEFIVDKYSPKLIQITLHDEMGFSLPLLAGNQGGKGEVKDVVVNGKSVSGKFTASLLRYDRNVQEIVKGEKPVAITGSFKVDLPDK